MEEKGHKFLSTQELGTLLGVTRQTIRNWINKGDIRAFHIGQNLKIPAEEVLRILTFYGLPLPHGLTREEALDSRSSSQGDEVKKSMGLPVETDESRAPGSSEDSIDVLVEKKWGQETSDKRPAETGYDNR
jgi:excisionase family DNA binding protein